MATGTPAEARQDMERVIETLRELKVHFAGRDQAESAVQRHEKIRHSPLRTAVDLATEAAGRVLEFIGNQAAASGDPRFQPQGRDGGPA